MTPLNSAALRRARARDLLLDRVARDHPVDHHRAGLADAVGAVDRLGLGGGVPPRVEQEAVVGLGEVQAEPARLEADQEHRVRAVLEALEHAIAPARAAVEVAVADALAVEALADLGQESRELAEDERPVAAADDVAQLLDERAELGARHGVVVVVDEARMQAELAQQRDRAQDREAVAVEVVDQPEDLLTLALQMRVVELAVARMQVDLEGLLLLCGEIRGHQLLRAALDAAA